MQWVMKVWVGMMVAFLPVVAWASDHEVDYSTLTDGIDFGTAILAVLAAGAAVAGLLIVVRGTRTILGFIRR